MKRSQVYLLFVLLLTAGGWVSCKKSGDAPAGGGGGTDTTGTSVAFDINTIHDTYDDVAAYSMYLKWGSYNVHDPSIKKFGDYYYCYSTDVGYGTAVPAGIQIRKSKDLVQWQYVGWVFNRPGKTDITLVGIYEKDPALVTRFVDFYFFTY